MWEAFKAEADLVLDRRLFPYPHQPSLRKLFYKNYLQEYTAFVKSQAFLRP